MTLYYTLVFMLLLTEMGVFMMLVLPIPFTWRKKLFQFISENPVVAKLQYGMKITFIFILILFVDSVNRVYRVTRELSESPRGGSSASMGPERLEVQARKFYSQRNMYLCGFTLFLSLILNRTYSLILDVLRLEEKVAKYQGKGNTAGGAAPGGDAALKKELERKTKDLEAMKAQAEGLAREYNELSDRYEAAQTKETVPRKKL